MIVIYIKKKKKAWYWWIKMSKKTDIMEGKLTSVRNMISWLLCGWGGLPWWLSGEEYPCQCRRSDSTPQLGRSPGLGNGNRLQNYYLGNPMNRGGLRATVHGIARVGHNLAAKLSGEWIISSILSCCNKNLKQQMDQHHSPWMDQCYSSVLQLSFI